MPKTTEILELFGIDNCNNHEEVMNDIPDTNECNNKQWNKNATLMLLNLYKKYMKQFASTTTKNDKVWQELAKDMKTQKFFYSSVQCRDKFKYLKMRYVKKKDNMKRETGTENFKFDYFDEMDEIFGKKPNVTPVAIASSSRSINQGKQH
jgi:alpha-acetolactate decarboxylase